VAESGRGGEVRQASVFEHRPDNPERDGGSAQLSKNGRRLRKASRSASQLSASKPQIGSDRDLFESDCGIRTESSEAVYRRRMTSTRTPPFVPRQQHRNLVCWGTMVGYYSHPNASNKSLILLTG